MRRFAGLSRFLILFLALSVLFAASPPAANAQVSVGISVGFGPPPIPYYVQPPDPFPNYIWSPGYWAYDNGYYWVPGTWVPAPSYGLLWTPGYWGSNGAVFVFYPGYWAPQIGFYGGVNYGYGYYGRGYVGGHWFGDQFVYNTAVTRVDTRVIHSVYTDRSQVVSGWNHVSYNGGRGGVSARPTQSELNVRRGHTVAATSVQTQHQHLAAANRANFSSVNRGRPATAAVARPLGSANRTAPARPAQPQAHAAPQQHAAPQMQHASPQQHAAPQMRHAAPQVQHAAPQPQHSAPQMQHAAPQVQHAAPPSQLAAQHMLRAAPQEQRAAPQQQRAPEEKGAPDKDKR